MTTTPACPSTLLAPDFPRLDMLQPQQLLCCTPSSLGLALRGEVGLGSPNLGKDDLCGLQGASSKPFERPCHGEQPPVLAAGPLTLPIAPLAIPGLLQGNCTLPFPSNVRPSSAMPEVAVKGEDMPPPPPVPLAATNGSSMPVMVPAEPAAAGRSPSGSLGSAPAVHAAGSSPNNAGSAAGLLPIPLPVPGAVQVQPAAAFTGTAQVPVESRPMVQAGSGSSTLSGGSSGGGGGGDMGSGGRPSSGGVHTSGSAGAAAAGAVPATATTGGHASNHLGDEHLSDHRLTLEFLEEHGYFDMPIQQAAAELRVGVTTLKKVCRVNNIGRWPFRKRSSLNRLIEKTREYFASDPEQCAEALKQLEAQRSVLRAQQGEDIPDQVKRYRQSIFKLDYKVKKIAKERRAHRGPPLTDKAQVVRQLGVNTPANSILGILCHPDSSSDPHRGLSEMED